MKRRYSVAVIAGDGIGQEVVPAAISVIDAVAAGRDFEVSWTSYEWGSAYYRRHGRMMPEDALASLGEHDAILLGAVGSPDIPDVTTLWGLLIPIRRHFHQYVNLRPVSLLPGVAGPLATEATSTAWPETRCRDRQDAIGRRLPACCCLDW